MDKMKYKDWPWPENPETFHIDAVREPLYTIAQDNTVTYQGLGPLCRIISGRGVFQGPDAREHFNAMAVIMANGAVGELVHPLWGIFQAYFTGLDLEQDSREDYIVYSFTFREADEQGMIPPLPEEKEEIE